jgi:hypothetical protein
LGDKGRIAIRQTFVHLGIQDGAKTKLSRSRVEAPKLLLDALSAWQRETMYADNDDFVFPSEKLAASNPEADRSWSRITFARQRFGLFACYLLEWTNRKTPL